jgi:hypothetical protein
VHGQRDQTVKLEEEEDEAQPSSSVQVCIPTSFDVTLFLTWYNHTYVITE